MMNLLFDVHCQLHYTSNRVSSRGHQSVRLDQRAKPQVSDVTTEVTLVTGRGTGTRKIKIINN